MEAQPTMCCCGWVFKIFVRGVSFQFVFCLNSLTIHFLVFYVPGFLDALAITVSWLVQCEIQKKCDGAA